MRTVTVSPAVRLAGLLAITAALAGCGGSAPAAKAEVINEQLVFTAAADCAASGKVKIEQCNHAIEAAMSQHLAGSPIYRSLALCETTEGVDKCERMDAKNYRPRLVAVSLSVPAAVAAAANGTRTSGIPLYPTPAGQPGFRTLDKTILLIDGDLLAFSPQAIAAAELNSAPSAQ